MTYDELRQTIDSLSIERYTAYMEDFKRQELYFINPLNTNNLELLEKEWSDFNSMTKPFRRKSDWIQLEYLGIGNEEIYNILKSYLSDFPIFNRELATPDNVDTQDVEKYDEGIVAESTFIPAADDIDFDRVFKANNSARNLKLAKDWMKDTDFIMITPSSSLDELDDKWNAYNMMIKKHRRVSDWKALELFGLTNQQLYTYFRGILDDEEPIPEATPDDFGDEYENNDIDIPFNEMSFLKRYFKKLVLEESGKDISNALVKLMNKESTADKIISKKIIEDTINSYNDLTSNSLNMQINYSDMPMFTPDEMIDMGVFGHEPTENFFDAIGDDIIGGDSTVLEWFKQYRAIYNGLPISEEYDKINLERVRKLESVYRTTTVEQRMEDPKLSQTILEMGWNPLYEFTPEMRVMADMRINSLIENQFGHSQIIDLCGFRTLDTSKFGLNEKTSIEIQGKSIKPIYIIFEEGKSWFSKSIKKFTNGIYSHAAISFDTTMDKMYSYCIEGSENKYGGFVIENINDKDKNAHMGVYAVFVSEEIWETIFNNVMYFVDNVKQTSYSFTNILTMIFRIPYERNNSLICSQFVDRMLKLGGIDITNKKSSLVDPNYLRGVSKSNKNIYKIFEGKVKSYNSRVCYDRVTGLMNKISTYTFEATMSKDFVRESLFFNDSLNALGMIYEQMQIYNPSKNKQLKSIYETFYIPCMEAKEIPIRFNKEGDILINPINTDFKAEHARSHKLLVSYSAKKNYKGMKSELARLWMLNNMIEKRLNKKRFNKNKAKYLQDARALILNDFKKYLKEVLDKEPNFDFEKYFADSRYSDTVRVDKNILRNIIGLVKTVI